MIFGYLMCDATKSQMLLSILVILEIYSQERHP